MLKRIIGFLSVVILLSSCDSEPEKKEIKFVNVYSSRLPELMSPLYTAFQKETGIEVNALFLGKSALKRLMQEKELTKADVIIVSDIGRLSDLKKERLSQSVKDPVINQNIPEEYRDVDGHWFGLTRRIRAIAYSTDRVKPSDINGYDAFANSSFKGRVCSRSFAHPYNISMISSYEVDHGKEQTKAWLGQFKKNLAFEPSGVDRDQIKLIAAGKCDIAPVNHYYYADMINQEPTKDIKKKVKLLSLDLMKGGAYANISGAAVTKYAQNIEQAYEFIRFLSGEKGQKLFAEKDHEIPVNRKVSFDAGVLGGGEDGVRPISLSDVANKREAVLQTIYEMDIK